MKANVVQVSDASEYLGPRKALSMQVIYLKIAKAFARHKEYDDQDDAAVTRLGAMKN